VNVSDDPYSRGVTRHIHSIGGDRAIYHVQPGDSLSRIAMTLKLNAPLSRVMDAVYAANPKAFIAGNRDVLMAGVDLVLPRNIA
jgi:Tfp pilus assembly protein FimV